MGPLGHHAGKQGDILSVEKVRRALDGHGFQSRIGEDDLLETARGGIYPLETIHRGSANYLESGAKESLSNYYHARYDAAALDPRLRRGVTFARHNLAMDTSFGEMQVIVCRNVLIYFNRELQDHVLELFWDSLDNGGFLCLGDKETLSFTSVADRFDVVDEDAKIYKKRPVR
jgi:chemotaxis protein methyltransferase CheR